MEGDVVLTVCSIRRPEEDIDWLWTVRVDKREYDPFNLHANSDIIIPSFLPISA